MRNERKGGDKRDKGVKTKGKEQERKGKKAIEGRREERGGKEERENEKKREGRKRGGTKRVEEDKGK